jgi:hypothetical protein
MNRKLQCRHFALHLFEDHVHSIVLLRRMLVLEVMRDALQPLPHLQPSLPLHAPQYAKQVTWLDGLLGREKQRELVVVQIVLEWQLDLVTDDDRHTVADDGVKQPATRRSVSSGMKAEA